MNLKETERAGLQSAGLRREVLLPLAVEKAYTYLEPAELHAPPGSIVKVPLGSRELIGLVMDGAGEDVEAAKLRPILQVFDDIPPLSKGLRRFLLWLADWTLTPPGNVLRMILRGEGACKAPPPLEGLQWRPSALNTLRQQPTSQPPIRMTPQREKLIGYLSNIEQERTFLARELAEKADVSRQVIAGFVRLGILQICQIAQNLPNPAPIIAPRSYKLTSEQSQAADLVNDRKVSGFSTFLLDGVTGSGKTEVYFEAIARKLEAGLQILILLPEIALTQQFADRFKKRFSIAPALWHSQQSAARRDRIWHGVARGQIQAVIGARSSLFLPFLRLGLIVIDEEHDMSFKQSDGVRYHARDMAVLRAKQEDIPIILASATPSVESMLNANSGRYRHVRLTRRASGVELPEVKAIDLRIDRPPAGRWIAPILEEQAKRIISEGGQLLLFLNRRGYAPLTLCRACGYRFQCTNCAAWLVEHRFRGLLICHYCGQERTRPRTCPECDASESLSACGPGIERIMEEARTVFPGARLTALSSDNPGEGQGTVSRLEALRNNIDLITKGQFDIIVGTQILAKGFNFPHLRLVGVIDADLGLAHGDPRASEKSFQLISQVTGRAGREQIRGAALIQTHLPDHPMMRALLKGERDAFYAQELANRKRAGLPPFGRMAFLNISGPDVDSVTQFSRQLAVRAPELQGLRILGPAEPLIAILRGRHRRRIVVLCPKRFDLQSALRGWLKNVPPLRGGIRLNVDIDPYNFF